MFEAWNANLWANGTGLLLWMSHPAWHSTVWQTYDYDLDVNGAYYGARKGCEPVHVQANLPTWQVIAANHTPHTIKRVTVTAALYDLTGHQLGQPQQQTIDLKPSSTTTAFTVPPATGLPAMHLARLSLQDSSGNPLSQNTYWRYSTAGDMRALNSLARTRLSAHLTSNNTTEVAATVSNAGSTVAAMVRIGLRDRSGKRVLPTEYSDNYFWLLPGERRDITATTQRASAGQRLVVDAYNAPSVTAN
jgi:hypothetical protein